MFTVYYSVRVSVWFAARRTDSKSEAFATLQQADAKATELNRLPLERE